MLKVDSSYLFVRHYLPSGIGNNSPGFLYNWDSTVVKLGINTEAAESPVVYRDVKDSLQPPGPQQILDLVAWGSQRTDTIPNCRFVRTITLQHFVSGGNIVATSIKPRVALLTDYPNYNLRYPVLSQGSSGTYENRQGPVILETIIEDSCPGQENFNKKVLNIPYDYFIAEPPFTEIIHSGASLVQLTRRPFVSPRNDWWQNLRLMQKDTTIAEFCTSTRMFWRRKADEPKPFVFFGFCDTSGSNLISNPILDERVVKWNTKSIYPELDTANPYQFIPFARRDTFATEWFSVQNISTLNLIFNKTSNNLLNIFLQRKSDGRSCTLPIGLEPAQKVRNLFYRLLNRNPNELFRLVATKSSTQSDFCQHIILMPNVFDPDNFPRTFEIEAKTIDLENMGENPNISKNLEIIVFPNPATENVFVTAYLPIELLETDKQNNTKISLQIFNSLGAKIFETLANSGQTIRVSTENFSPGVYYLLAKCNIKLTTRQNKVAFFLVVY